MRSANRSREFVIALSGAFVVYGGEAAGGFRRHSDGFREAPVYRFPTDGPHQAIERLPWRRHSAFPEIDCVRGRLPLGVLAAVERRAIELGVSADRVLVVSGIMDEEAYAKALADWLGWHYEDFEHCARESCPLDDRQLIDAARTGLVPLLVNGQTVFVVAPRSVRQLLTFADKRPDLRFRLASSARFNRFISDVAAERLGEQAAHGLLTKAPQYSAAAPDTGWSMVFATIAALLVAALTAPWMALTVAQGVLAGCFLAWLALRLSVCSVHPGGAVLPRLSDRQLPVYTIMVALYRESESVAQLVEALRALDYPPEKLDIKLIIEPYDMETWTALQRFDLQAPFEIIVAPDIGPRTKPKALNAALPFAIGSFIVVYDAEDRPDPDQLRRAVATFGAESKAVACVQARLTIDNTRDGWLTRMFTAEYATQFDLFLPGLGRLGLPLPLGGSSNHFRMDVLRRLGAWDAYNVTEDADLGTRLARAGYRSVVINSSTYEEAPIQFVSWMRQRTRWLKGWMQTWAVHMRHPIQLWRDLGTAGFMTFQLAVGGNVLTALVHPFFLGTMIYFAATSGSIFGPDDLPWSLRYLFGAVCIAGYLVTIVLALRGLARRGLISTAWALALVPVHWIMLSIAAWRAAFQYWNDRYRWEKTEHGVARNSRLATTRRPAAGAGRVDRPANRNGIERRTAA